MSIADAIRVALERAGTSRAAARSLAASEMKEIERLVREGDAAGLGPGEMAQLARISRQTVYTILGKEDDR